MTQPGTADRPSAALRRALIPLALAQFIMGSAMTRNLVAAGVNTRGVGPVDALADDIGPAGPASRTAIIGRTLVSGASSWDASR